MPTTRWSAGPLETSRVGFCAAAGDVDLGERYIESIATTVVVVTVVVIVVSCGSWRAAGRRGDVDDKRRLVGEVSDEIVVEVNQQTEIDHTHNAKLSNNNNTPVYPALFPRLPGEPVPER